jgi:hypothetical protein
MYCIVWLRIEKGAVTHKRLMRSLVAWTLPGPRGLKEGAEL